MSASDYFTVLVVDDSPIDLKLLEKSLSAEGYKIILARNGAEGRKKAVKYKPDLILLDVMMPGEGGFEVIARLKEDKETVSIPVIFLTGKDDIGYKIKGFDLGAVDYVVKPFNLKEIKARVRIHLKLGVATSALVAGQAEKLKEVKEAQTSMLTAPQDLPEANFGVHYMSLHEAGGDFYDVLPISDDIFGYFVGDISGHDIKTSFITASLKALLKQNCKPVYSPLETVRMMNDVLLEIMPEEKFVTACYAKLNRKSMVLSIVSAGHPPAVYIPVEGEPCFLQCGGDILGAFQDVFYDQSDTRVKKGDRFYIFSDGLFEQPQSGGWVENRKRVLESSKKIMKYPIQNAVSEMVSLMWNSGAHPEDDIVVLGFEV
ncbi:MAG: SpoIIE family protein phosphatase [Nitrospinota bacterium]